MSDPRMLVFEAGISLSRVEASKAALEKAKADHAAAKEAHDAVLQRCEEAGIPKSGLRKAVEMITQAFAEAGIETPAEEEDGEGESAQADAPKPRRRRKSSKEDRQETGQGGNAEEKAAAQNAEAPAELVEETPAAAQEAQIPADETAAPSTAEIPAEEAPADDVPAPAEQEEVSAEAEAVPAPETAGPEEYDFSDEREEVSSLIDEMITPGTDDRHDEARAFLNAIADALVSTARASGTGFDVDAFRAGLDRQTAFDLTHSADIEEDTASALLAGLAWDECDRVVEWARDALAAIESGGDVTSAVGPLFPEDDAAAPAEEPATEEPADEPPAPPARKAPKAKPAEPAAEAAEDERDYAFAEPDHGMGSDLPSADDDRSFSLEEAAAVDDETVEDIGEINFLSDPEESGQDDAEEPAPEEGAVADGKPADAGEQPKTTFTPPPFLKRRGA